MEQLQLTITVANGQTLFAEVRPEDERKLAELLGDRSSIQLAPTDDDLEGHAMSDDIVVDVEGHAMVLRLPRPADAASLRRALAVGAVTATLVGAGAIAGLRPAAQTTPAVEIPAVRQQVQTVPAAALRAQQNEMTREQSLNAIPRDVDNPAVPPQALRADSRELSVPVPAPAVAAQQDEMTQQQGQQAVPLDADNPAVPAQALHAERNGEP
jgi:hypothetical protein